VTSQEQDVLRSPREASGGASGDGALEPELHPHDFDVQKQIHQQIRNDPDYDDWEYGTEPLPHEAWVVRSELAAAKQAGANQAGTTDGSAPA
jgi:hypothetical protein